MTTILVAFLIAFAVAVVATRLVIVLATRAGLLDKPDGYRHIHLRDTPRLGGVAIYVGLIAPIVLLFAFSELSQVSRLLFVYKSRLLGLLVCGTLALALGVADDIVSLKVRWKLAMQIVVGIVAVSCGFTIKAVSNPFGPAFALGIFAVPVAVFWFVGCMNAVNLLDGLDGLAAGTCLLVSMTLFLVGLQFENILGMFLAASIAGAILGFLVFNFPPARIFMGDSGSMFLGFLVAAISLVGTSRKAEVAVALFVPLVALGVPIFDTSVAILRRWYKKLPIAEPDRGHIHHMMVSMGYSQRRTVLILYVISVLLAGAALLLTMARNEVIILVLGSLVITAFVTARVVSGVRVSDIMMKLSQDARRRESLARARIAVERAAAGLAAVGSVDAAWSLLREPFGVLDLGYVKMTLRGENVSGAWEWRREVGGKSGNAPGGGDGWQASLRLEHGGVHLGDLVFGNEFAEHAAFPDGPELLERIRDAVCERVYALEASGKR